ncbi:hypothetical protein CYMTET_26387 [Cymbomonas tetramitiformis]|uniref:sn-1-specific diacylglycerol lipase n=1 Tax=Cymbomonas tetramitiformis TaxID=36881 RepID=A0AAE0FKL2_9CHLO|nr:hypothetical protein CYMTET_29844 [Cymbomonas tetramitiformis]KAK3264899.1 hypothetical protein CYMTET_26387 [Cymbomonas tetramitiformis]
MVLEQLEKLPEWQVVITGHSLGAGVAALLALQWRSEMPAVQCYAFAPPCTMSIELARATASFITSVILKDDFVCR